MEGKVDVYADDGTAIGVIDFNITGVQKSLPHIRFDCNQVLFGSIFHESSIYSYTTNGVLVNQFTLSGSDYVTYILAHLLMTMEIYMSLICLME